MIKEFGGRTLRITHKVISVLAYGQQDDSLSSVTLYPQFRWPRPDQLCWVLSAGGWTALRHRKGAARRWTLERVLLKVRSDSAVSVGHHVSLSSDYRVKQTSSEIIRTSFRIILIPRISQCSGGKTQRFGYWKKHSSPQIHKHTVWFRRQSCWVSVLPVSSLGSDYFQVLCVTIMSFYKRLSVSPNALTSWGPYRPRERLSPSQLTPTDGEELTWGHAFHVQANHPFI